MTAKKTETETVDPKTGEITTTEPTAAPPVEIPSFDLSGYDVEKLVTVPVLQLPIDVVRGVRITEPLFEGKEIKSTGRVSKKPATLANVVNLQNGETAQIVVPAVLEANLREQYPDDSYVGKSFAVQNNGKREGKEYNDIRIMEIKPKTA